MGAHIFYVLVFFGVGRVDNRVSVFPNPYMLDSLLLDDVGQQATD